MIFRYIFVLEMIAIDFWFGLAKFHYNLSCLHDQTITDFIRNVFPLICFADDFCQVVQIFCFKFQNEIASKILCTAERQIFLFIEMIF